MAVSEEVHSHAVKRIRGRLGLPKKAAEREALRALDGLRIDELGGRLRRYMDNLRHYHGHDADYRLTPAGVFAYRHGMLVTVFKIDVAHKKSAQTQWQKLRKRQEKEEAS